jgi:hypothetical protein
VRSYTATPPRTIIATVSGPHTALLSFIAHTLSRVIRNVYALPRSLVLLLTLPLGAHSLRRSNNAKVHLCRGVKQEQIHVTSRLIDGYTALVCKHLQRLDPALPACIERTGCVCTRGWLASAARHLVM